MMLLLGDRFFDGFRPYYQTGLKLGWKSLKVHNER
jgi:hypothetical protein